MSSDFGLHRILTKSTGKKNATYKSGRIIKEGYKTLTFRGGRLHLKSWCYLTDY